VGVVNGGWGGVEGTLLRRWDTKRTVRALEARERRGRAGGEAVKAGGGRRKGRVELGEMARSTTPRTFQVHRGRLQQALLQARGLTCSTQKENTTKPVWAGTRVRHISSGGRPNTMVAHLLQR
jgi:hypothetical protein